jgi:hypothetical protein
VINFGKMGSDAASLYPSAWQIVSERVRPDRQASKVKGLRERWWQFEHHASGLYEAIAERSRTLAIAEVSYTVQPAFVSTDQVFMHKVIVIAEDSDECFGLMSSAFHYWWTVSEAASFRTAPSYSPSDVYETFAQPGGSARRDLEEVAQIAKDLDRFRSDLMTHTNVGLTKTYNRVHDQGELDPDVVRLRELHVQLDHAVRDAYGWSELVLGHHHWETPQGMRFTVSPEAKDELLDRLLELNHQRYAEEVAAGLHDTKKAKGSKKTASNQGSLDIG